MNGYVYLIGDNSKEGYCKIGVTRGDIQKRIKKLQTGNGGEIFLIDKFYSKHPFYIEKWLHKKFFSNKLIGEWFQMSQDDINNFQSICQNYEKNFDTLNDNPFFQGELIK